MIYPIGVWYQPADVLPRWKSMGVSFVVGCPVDMTQPLSVLVPLVNAWTASLAGQQVGFFLQSGLVGNDPNKCAWLNSQYCMGVLIEPDEPNAYTAGTTPLRTPAQMQAIADGIRNLTNKPILLDLDGAALIYQPDDGVLAAYCACADIISADYYACNRGFDRGDLLTNGKIIDRICKVAPGKKLFGIPEVNDQGLHFSGYFPNGRGPTGAELSTILSDLPSRTDGLVIFADTFGLNDQKQYVWQSFGIDAITAECAAALTGFAGKMNPALPSPVTPAVPAKGPLEGFKLSGGSYDYFLRMN